MRIAAILTRTPTEEGFRTFMKFINVYLEKEDLKIYLLGNGVYCARGGHVISPQIHSILMKAPIYASSEDLRARGIKREQLIPGVNTFESYEELVLVLMEEIDEILSF